jgi:hypothetical protein
MDGRGVLQMAWPTATDGGAVTLDFLLAISTKMECTRPTPDEVADAWVDQPDGHERYFFENIRNGIRTIEDLAVWRRIALRSPNWVDKTEYAAAVGLLREEDDIATK